MRCTSPLRVSRTHSIFNGVTCLARPRTRRAIFAALVAVASLSIGGGPTSAPTAVAQDPEYDLPLPYLTPIPVVRLAGELTRAGVRVRLLRVKAPRNSKVTLRCRGGRRNGCRFRSKTKIAPRGGRVRFKAIERALRAGVRLKIYVRRGETVGKYTGFVIRKGRAPRRADACIFPGDPFEPRLCP